MDDKKVILNKTEFDNMETELNNLRKVVESRTVAKIKTPPLGWSPTYGDTYIDRYYVDYVVGCDENEVVKELSAEIEKLKKEKGELNHIVNGLETKIRWFQSQQDEWKNLPWYKRVFV
jgi:hypothetical protein